MSSVGKSCSPLGNFRLQQAISAPLRDMRRESALVCALLCAALLIEMLLLYIERRRVSNKLIQAVLMGSVFWLNKRHVAGRPWGVACLVFMFFPVAFGLCVIFFGPYLLDRAALVDAAMKVRAAFQDHQP